MSGGTALMLMACAFSIGALLSRVLNQGACT
jgi:hypothetical protein